MRISFKALNANTSLDVFCLPRIADLFNRLVRDRYYSSFDLENAYYSVKIAAEDTHKTVFLTNEGFYEYLVMHFGLCYATATF